MSPRIRPYKYLSEIINYVILLWHVAAESQTSADSTQLFILFTQPLRSGRIWHKVNFLSGV